MIDTTETYALTHLLIKRFNGDIDEAHRGWKRLLQNNCSLQQFRQLTRKVSLDIQREEFLEVVDRELHQLKAKLDADVCLSELEAFWFDEMEPQCGTVNVRKFLDAKYLNPNDAAIFSETLIKNPSFDLLSASKMAALDAYREFLNDRFNILFGK